MPSTTSAETLSWPTADDATRALADVGVALEKIEEIGLNYLRLVEAEVVELNDGAEPPTFQDLGVLTRLVELLDTDVHAMKFTLRQITAVRDAAALLVETSVDA